MLEVDVRAVVAEQARSVRPLRVHVVTEGGHAVGSQVRGPVEAWCRHPDDGEDVVGLHEGACLLHVDRGIGLVVELVDAELDRAPVDPARGVHHVEIGAGAVEHRGEGLRERAGHRGDATDEDGWAVTPFDCRRSSTVTLAFPQAANEMASTAVTRTRHGIAWLSFLRQRRRKRRMPRWGRITLRGAGDPAQPCRGPGFCRGCGIAAARGRRLNRSSTTFGRSSCCGSCGRPMWLAGLSASIVGTALQLIALWHGSLVTVQPLLVCGLLFALPINAIWMHRRRPGRPRAPGGGNGLSRPRVLLVATDPRRGGEPDRRKAGPSPSVRSPSPSWCW